MADSARIDFIEPVSIRVFDVAGRMVQTKTNSGNGLVEIGLNLGAGTYFAEIRQGVNREVVKLIKTK